MLLDVAAPPTSRIKNAAVGLAVCMREEETSDPHHDRSRFRLFSFFVPKAAWRIKQSAKQSAQLAPSPLVRLPRHQSRYTSRRGTKRETFKS